ncbi:hypothetical protein AB3X52_07750 [Nocardioides sp. DS6]|uniref:DUF222 domain-containing protein n=1 Tax=Nocardioides eburneus TaxID=3231482 RepID=A0ABV3SX42_9ACTN
MRERRAVLVEELELCLAWADLHGVEPTVTVPGGDHLVRLGGDGTPLVRDLCLEELSIARQVHVANTRAAMADALDLRHRLPQVWAAVRGLTCEPWLARRVARMSRQLAAGRIGLVDTAVVDALGQAPSRVLAVAEAAIIEADTAAYDAELTAKRAEQGVWLGRVKAADPDDPDSGRGVQSFFARLAPEDAVWLDATITELAGHLATDDSTVDQSRAAALAMLARPDEAAAVLGLRGDDEQPAVSRQKAVVYVHLHESSLLAGEGVARTEACGPLLVSRLAELVGHARIDLKPVIDLNAGASVNAYEHPASMRERVVLRSLGDVFPHASALGRRVDLDHPTPYAPDGPPGQTSDLNAAPLGRRSHRAKTHLGYRLDQLGPASYLWTTPHGLVRLVTPDRGTTALEGLRLEIHRAYVAA